MLETDLVRARAIDLEWTIVGIESEAIMRRQGADHSRIGATLETIVFPK